MPSDTRYRAFISYSHADSSFAKLLHRNLEGYRIPKRLVGTLGARGEITERLTPVFRDIDELAASEDLTAEIKDALAVSETLIVLCSPAAKQSQWVNREIALFRELHKSNRPILAAVVSGEPGDVLPAALALGRTKADPIAADFREGQDGRNLALLKLVAGMTGASLGALVQRDAQRRMRRVMAITAGAVAALLVMSTLTWVAIRARAEAERQRTSAEGLVEFMLTDLREKLKGVGRLDVMGPVNERAMAYYGDAKLDALPPESLERRARILHALGEDAANDGDPASALRRYREAHRATAATLEKRPNDPDSLFAHAQSEYFVGLAADGAKDFKTAAVHWQAYLARAQQLANAEPGTPRALMELSYANGNLCALDFRQNANAPTRLGTAQQLCEQSVQFAAQAYEKTPSNEKTASAYANRLGWLANIYIQRGAFARAQQQLAAEQSILLSLLKKDPQNTDLQLRTLWQVNGMARVLLAQGHSARAFETARSGIDQSSAMLARTGNRQDLMQFRLKLLIWLATEQRKSGLDRWSSTLAEAEAAFATMKATASDPTNIAAFAGAIDKVRKGE